MHHWQGLLLLHHAPGREVSRLHAMVVFRDVKVTSESVSKTNHGREVLAWHREGKKIVKRSVKIAAGVGRVAPMTFLRGIMRMRGDV